MICVFFLMWQECASIVTWSSYSFILCSMSLQVHWSSVFSGVFVWFILLQGSGGRPLTLSRCPCQNTIDRMTEELEYADKTPDVQGGCPSNAERSCQSEPGEMCVCVCVFWYKAHYIVCLQHNCYFTDILPELYCFIEHQNKRSMVPL